MRTTPLPSTDRSVPVMRVFARVSSVMSPSPLSSGDLGVQGVHARLPQRSVGAQPFVDFCERLGTQVVHPKLRFLAHVDEAGMTQDSQVSRDARTSDRQQCGQLTHGGGTVAERLQHGSPACVRQRLQHRIHGLYVSYWVRTRQVTYGVARWNCAGRILRITSFAGSRSR